MKISINDLQRNTQDILKQQASLAVAMQQRKDWLTKLCSTLPQYHNVEDEIRSRRTISECKHILISLDHYKVIPQYLDILNNMPSILLYTVDDDYDYCWAGLDFSKILSPIWIWDTWGKGTVERYSFAQTFDEVSPRQEAFDYIKRSIPAEWFVIPPVDKVF